MISKGVQENIKIAQINIKIVRVYLVNRRKIKMFRMYFKMNMNQMIVK